MNLFVLNMLNHFCIRSVNPDCKGGGLETKSRKLDTKAELMAFFTLCRQSLHLGIMARVVHSKLVCQELLLDGLYSYQPQYLNVLNPNHYLGLSQAYLPQECML